MIRNSVRAFIAALVPLAVYHGMTMALVLGGFVADRLNLPTPDRTFSIFMLRLAVDASFLFCGHMLLRIFRRPTRVAYALMGGSMAATGYVTTLWFEVWLKAPFAGTQLTGLILPIFAGMIAGFLYAQLAGREPAVRRWPWSLTAAPATGPINALAAFEGPVQVRTSIAGIVIAATVPAVLMGALTIPLGVLAFGNLIPTERQPDSSIMQVMQLAFPAQIFLSTLFATIIPSTIVVCATHGIARALGWNHGGQYALVGAVVNCVAALLLVLMINPALLFPAAAIAGGLMGALYRRFAGLEPLPLPEPVLVNDHAALVGADHPARRQHVVITNG